MERSGCTAVAHADEITGTSKVEMKNHVAALQMSFQVVKILMKDAKPEAKHHKAEQAEKVLNCFTCYESFKASCTSADQAFLGLAPPCYVMVYELLKRIFSLEEFPLTKAIIKSHAEDATLPDKMKGPRLLKLIKPCLDAAQAEMDSAKKLAMEADAERQAQADKDEAVAQGQEDVQPKGDDKPEVEQKAVVTREDRVEKYVQEELKRWLRIVESPTSDDLTAALLVGTPKGAASETRFSLRA